MHVSLVVILFLLSFSGFGQSKETFLMYEARIDSAYTFKEDNKSQKLFRVDTSIYLREFVTLSKGKITLRSFPFRHSPNLSKRSSKYKREGDKITFLDYKKLTVAHIHRDPVFNWDNHSNVFFVPIKIVGLKVAPFEGQLIEYYPSGGKMKFIQDTIRGKQSQMTYLINFGQISRAEDRLPMIYLDNKYLNLMTLPGILGWFQLNKISGDSIWYVNIYPLQAYNKDSTALHSTFIKKSLLSKAVLKQIKENLHGKWSQTSGVKLNYKLAPDSSRTIIVLDSLKDCKYTFTFDKDKLVLERSSINPEINTIDTVSYSINSTGDWIWTKGKEGNIDIILDKIDSKSARFSVEDLKDGNNNSCRGSLVLYLQRE